MNSLHSMDDPMEMRAILREVEQLDRDLQALLQNDSPTATPTLLRPSKYRYLNEVSEQDMQTVQDVEIAMQMMDSRYQTAFYPWIRSESNVDTISQHLRRFISELDAPAIARGLQWLFEKWSMNGVTTLFIKLFYEHGLSSPLFTDTVRLLCQQWSWDRSVDLIGTLLIGEDAPMTARFIQAVTRDWPADQVVDLVHTISKTSRWTPAFHEEFLAHFAAVDPRWETKSADRILALQRVQKTFAERAQALDWMPADKRTLFYGHSHRQFCQTVLFQLLQERQSGLPAEESPRISTTKVSLSDWSTTNEPIVVSPTKYHSPTSPSN